MHLKEIFRLWCRTCCLLDMAEQPQEYQAFDPTGLESESACQINKILRFLAVYCRQRIIDQYHDFLSHFPKYYLTALVESNLGLVNSKDDHLFRSFWEMDILVVIFCLARAKKYVFFFCLGPGERNGLRFSAPNSLLSRYPPACLVGHCYMFYIKDL